MINILGRHNKTFDEDIIRIFNEISNCFSLPENIEVNLTFVSEKRIKDLNNSTRNINKVTDVLSYPYTELKVGEKLDIDDYKLYVDMETGLLSFGDIYICSKRAEQQAEEYGHSLKREICFLFCHGMLHCCGYDHIIEKDAKIMEEMQNKILTKLGITRSKFFKSGFVTILGETNAGKSTLLNSIIGEFVAIVSPKSQTTRENIQGIYNEENCQIVFVDTPGYHKRTNKVDEEMEKHIENAQQDTEIVLMLITANKPLVEQYEKLNKKINANAKKILLINKIDETKFEKLYPQLAQLNEVAKVDEILPISAKTKKNVDVLIEMIKKYLRTFDYEMRYYPVDEYTNKNLRHMCAEIIREKALLLLDDEIPHGIQVVVTDYKENENPVQIYADLYCEKENHKAIILGKNGDMIKKISTMARKSIEYVINQQVNLQVYVKVKPNWRNDSKMIEELGLSFEE